MLLRVLRGLVMAWESFKAWIYGSLETEDATIRVAVVAADPENGIVRYRRIPDHITVGPGERAHSLGPEEEAILAAFTTDPGQGEI